MKRSESGTTRRHVHWILVSSILLNIVQMCKVHFLFSEPQELPLPTSPTPTSNNYQPHPPVVKYDLERSIQEEDDSPQGAFPYRLTCPGDALPATPGVDYSIALAYHVGMIKNWKTIVRDQMNTLQECGLGAAASDFILSYSGGPLEQIQNVVRPYNLFVSEAAINNASFNTTTSSTDATTKAATSSTARRRQRRTSTAVNSTKAPWEGPIMNQIHEYCSAQEAATPKKPTIVFYFHNKGASKYHPNWQTSNGQYKKTLYWRKYMEYYLHERPNLCLNELLYNKPGTVRPGMCGIMWHRTHYSGNFWSANCHYIATALQPIDLSVKQNYIAGELWIGKGQNARKEGRRPVSLHENPSGIGLYKHAMEPHEYSDYHMWWKSNLNVGTANISSIARQY